MTDLVGCSPQDNARSCSPFVIPTWSLHSNALAAIFNEMKFIQKHLLQSILAVLLVATGAGVAQAYDHDKTGWYDDHHHHHSFVKHNGHRGYWDHDKGGAKIFINV
jgi:hypothetical protein